MKILSLNVIGLGGKTKLCSLRSLFHSVAPDMVILKETMCSSYPALLSFSKILPNWEFYAIDASGISGHLRPGTHVWSYVVLLKLLLVSS